MGAFAGGEGEGAGGGGWGSAEGKGGGGGSGAGGCGELIALHERSAREGSAASMVQQGALSRCAAPRATNLHAPPIPPSHGADAREEGQVRGEDARWRHGLGGTLRALVREKARLTRPCPASVLRCAPPNASPACTAVSPTCLPNRRAASRIYFFVFGAGMVGVEWRGRGREGRERGGRGGGRAGAARKGGAPW